MNYKYNKPPKDKDLLRLIRKAITKDIRRNGLTLEDFANEIGLSAGTLDNKLKPSCDVNLLSIDEFIQILDITADYEPLEYIAKRYGFVLCKTKGGREEIENKEFFITIKTLELEEFVGAFAGTVKEFVGDGVVDEEERKRLKDELFGLIKFLRGVHESL